MRLWVRLQPDSYTISIATAVAAVTVQDRKGERVVAKDETPFTCDIAKIPNLKPAFGKDGIVTAASSSSISDGAAALVVVSAATARASNLKPLARIVAHASYGPIAGDVGTIKGIAWTPERSIVDLDRFYPAAVNNAGLIVGSIAARPATAKW